MALKERPSSLKQISRSRTVRRLFGLVWKYRWGCLLLLATQMALLGLNLFGVAMLGVGIDELRHAVDPAAPEPRWPMGWTPMGIALPMHRIAVISLALLAVALLRLWLGYASGVWFGQLLQGRLVVDLRDRCYDKLQRLNFRFFDSNTSSSLINRIGGDIQAVRLFVDGVLFQVVILVVSVGLFLAYMLSVHVGLTLACLSTMPLVWAVSALFSKAVKPAYKESSELYDSLVERLAESIRGMHVIKAFAREAAEFHRFQHANQRLCDAQNSIFAKLSGFVPLIVLLSQANVVVLLLYGGTLAMRGEIGIGTGLVGFASILGQFSGQISGVGNIANSMQQCLRSAERVFQILDEPVQIHSPDHPRAFGQLGGEVRFEKVSFSYGAERVLEEVDFEVKKGECVVITGPTGSGKSTLLSLIPRFYDPGAGRVLVDGMDIQTLDLAALRRSVGCVFQESFLFSTSVAANIAFGHPEASDAQVEKAARLASAHAFIQQLPEGYRTVLGEAGVGLSGGQKQRLSIARALLLEPAILLLDDPTASLDAETEELIVDALRGAMRERTTFIVSQRPSLLRLATQILVLDRGRLVQRGTHRELAGREGYYRHLVEVQEGGVWDGEERPDEGGLR
jgi:ATP-binding cassette subfamily B protein